MNEKREQGEARSRYGHWDVTKQGEALPTWDVTKQGDVPLGYGHGEANTVVWTVQTGSYK